MTMRVGSPLKEKMINGTTAKHAARNGSSRVPIRNDHFNTTFLYSCFTTAKNFFINTLRSRDSADFIDENVVETRFYSFELRNFRSTINEFPQQKLGSVPLLR
jgi:hypothetical protein